MAITYYMLQIHPVVFFILIVLSFAVLTGLATLLFRKYIKVRILRAHNEVTGFLFLSIASFYALLLSFIVLVVWDELNETHSRVSMEGSSAVGLYRDIRFYPDTAETKQLSISYLEFVYNVVDDEFPAMAEMKTSRKTVESFNKVFAELENLKPQTPYKVQLVSGMFNHLNDVATYRGLRMASMETEISAPLWLPIIMGALITILCAILLDLEHKRMHVIITSFLGAFIGMFLFLIILLDHPFTGSLRIEPKSYMQIFTMEQWRTEALHIHPKPAVQPPATLIITP